MLTRKTKGILVDLMKSDSRSFFQKAFRFLLTLPNSQRHEVYTNIQANSILRTKFCNCMYGHSLSNLGNYSFTYNNTLQDNDAFEYACFISTLFSDKINRFVYLRNQYQRFFLLKRYEEAANTLQTIDNEICVSLWSCGQHMLLKELEQGLTANKQLLDQYSHTLPSNYITQVVLFYFSVLAEQNTGYDNYQTQIEKYIKQLPDSPIKSYLSQKLLLIPPSSQFDFSLSLQIDSQYSIIDLYNDLEIYLPIYYFSKLCNQPINSRFLHSFSSTVVSPLATNIGLLLAISENSDNISLEKYYPNANKQFEIIEQYTSGHYQLVMDNSEDYLLNKPYDFQIAIIYCKALIHCNKELPNAFPVSYIRSIFSIYKNDTYCKESIASLKNYLKQYYGMTLHIKIQSFLCRKTVSNIKEPFYYSTLVDEVLHPNFVQFLCPSYARVFVDKYLSKCPNSIALTVFLDAQQGVLDPQKYSISPYYHPFIVAENLCRLNDFKGAEEVLITAESKCLKSDLYTLERIKRMRLRILGYRRDHAEAIQLLVTAFFINETLFERLICGKEYSFPTRIRDVNITKEIDYVIFVFLSHRNNYHRQISAYSNFLDNNNITIQEYVENASLDDIRTRFFLENVCTINLLKRDASLFSAGITAESVRLEILKKLYHHNPQKSIMDEIQEISTNEVIRDNLRSINTSKINVDVDKIFSTFQVQWEENYNKYLLLRKTITKTVSIDLSNDSFKSLADNLNMRISNSADVNQETVVLKGIIEQILEECLYNTQYGLETYLSSRLRHGYCKEQLSSFLNELNIISLKNEGDNQFLINDYWELRLLPFPELYQQVLHVLSIFTSKIENKIEEIRGEWLHINSPAFPAGMFDYSSLVSTFLVAYQNDYFKEFHIFYNRVIELFWIITEKCLETIRLRIKDDLQEFYITSIDELERSVNSIPSDSSTIAVIRELTQNCALAKSKVVSVMQEFQTVFSIKKSEYKNFYMHDLSDSCKRITEKLFPNSSLIQWKIDADTLLMFSGQYFASFVDILCILLNNSITHSGFTDISQVSIDIDINECKPEDKEEFINITNSIESEEKIEHVFCMSVTNNVSPSVDINIIEEKLSSSFQAITKEKDGAQYIQSEGGSGLYKLTKTADYNLEGKYCVLYSVTDHTVTIGYEFVADHMLAMEGNK